MSRWRGRESTREERSEKEDKEICDVKERKKE